MSKMFYLYDNMPEDYVPNNHPKHCKCNLETVVIGASVNHVFEMPFLFSEYCKDCKVIYKQCLTNIIVKGMNELEILEEPRESGECDDRTYIQVELSPEETSLFANHLETNNTFVQLKLTLNDDSIEYSRIMPIKVLTTLDNGGLTNE